MEAHEEISNIQETLLSGISLLLYYCSWSDFLLIISETLQLCLYIHTNSS